MEKCLGLFTFLPMDEVRALGALDGALINRAKEILAYEVTANLHGHEEAGKAYLASGPACGAAAPEGEVRTSSRIMEVKADRAEDVPTTMLEAGVLEGGMNAADLMVAAGLAKSKGEARRLIRGGGAYVNGERIDDEERLFRTADLKEGALVLRAGKKRYHRLRWEPERAGRCRLALDCVL